MDVRCQPLTETVRVAPQVLCRDFLFGETTGRDGQAEGTAVSKIERLLQKQQVKSIGAILTHLPGDRRQ